MYTPEMTDFINTHEIMNKKLRNAYMFGEATTDENVIAANNSVNMIVVEKSMNNMKIAASSVLTFNQGKMDEVVDKAEKINSIATAISVANKEKSQALKIHSDCIRVVKNFNKKFAPKYGKGASYQGDIIVAGLNLLLVEYTGIIAEAIISVNNGTSDKIDDYVLRNGKYKESMDNIDGKINKFEKELYKLGEEIYKESHGIESLHPLESFLLEDNDITLHSEATTSIFRVFKALLFKPLYIIMAPIRYIIYMFMLAGFSIADRLTQIGETIALYDENSSMSPTHREQKMLELEKTSSRARMDRADTDGKVYKKTEDEKAALSKDVDGSVNKASLSAIF